MDEYRIERYAERAHVFASELRTIKEYKCYYKTTKIENKINYSQGYVYLPEDWIDRETISLLLEPINPEQKPIAKITNNGKSFEVYGIQQNSVKKHIIRKGYSSGKMLYSGVWVGKQVLVLLCPVDEAPVQVC